MRLSLGKTTYRSEGEKAKRQLLSEQPHFPELMLEVILHLVPDEPACLQSLRKTVAHSDRGETSSKNDQVPSS